MASTASVDELTDFIDEETLYEIEIHLDVIGPTEIRVLDPRSGLVLAVGVDPTMTVREALRNGF